MLILNDISSAKTKYITCDYVAHEIFNDTNSDILSVIKVPFVHSMFVK